MNVKTMRLRAARQEFLLFFFLIAPYFLTLSHGNARVFAHMSLGFIMATFVVWVIVFSKKKRFSINYIIYFAFSFVLAPATALFSIDINYAVSRSLVSVVNALVVISTFHLLISSILEARSSGKLLSALSLVVIASLIGAEFLLQDWSTTGNWRVSGGGNPNTFGLLAVTLLFLLTALALNSRRMHRITAVAIALSLVAVLLSMSRSSIAVVIVTAFTLVTLYYSTNIFIGKTINLTEFKMLGVAVFSFALIIFMILFTYMIGGTLAERLFNMENIVSRAITWGILLKPFLDNPLFGGIGWWESSSFIEQIAPHGSSSFPVASSAHNIYVAILAETGVVGSLFIFGSVVIIVCRVFAGGLRWLRQDRAKAVLMLFSGSAVVGFFVREFFEDTFLRGIFSFHNTALLSVISFALVMLKKQKSARVERSMIMAHEVDQHDK